MVVRKAYKQLTIKGIHIFGQSKSNQRNPSPKNQRGVDKITVPESTEAGS